MTHICVGKTIIILSDNGLSPGRRQAIIWTNSGILSIGPLGTNYSEILIEIYKFSFKKIHLKVSSGKWRPSCLGLNVLKLESSTTHPQIIDFFGPYDLQIRQMTSKNIRKTIPFSLKLCVPFHSHINNQIRVMVRKLSNWSQFLDILARKTSKFDR